MGTFSAGMEFALVGNGIVERQGGKGCETPRTAAAVLWAGKDRAFRLDAEEGAGLWRSSWCWMTSGDAGRLMLRILTRLGHDVRVFCRADEARQWLKTSEPDLALLDIKLKEDNGLSFLKFLRAQWPAVKVIMVTGYPSSETAQEAVRLGIEDYLIKPLEIEDLESRVRKALEKRSIRG